MATTTPEERAEAAEMRCGAGATSNAALAAMQSVDIEFGVQKYVLIRAGDRHLVRGRLDAAYHKDAAAPCVAQLQAHGIDYAVLGGGRIRADEHTRQILVYGTSSSFFLSHVLSFLSGFSYGFPWPGGVTKHDLAASLIRQDYPDWSVTTSDEGY